MNRHSKRAWTSLLAVGSVVALAACGSSSSSTSSATSSAATSNGTITEVFGTAPDSLDPGMAYTTQALEPDQVVYTPLLGYAHVAGAAGGKLIAGLATALPTISSDGKTYTLTLRKGLKYSNGTTVMASDFQASIERDFKIDSPGVGFFGNIVGASEFAKTKTGHITGIVTNNSTGKITITLTSPQGDFSNILATEFAALLPASTPAKDQSTTPAPSTGPYMIQSYTPNKTIVEVRNPNFDASLFGGNVPVGNPDKVVWDIIGDDNVALQRVISGQDDCSGITRSRRTASPRCSRSIRIRSSCSRRRTRTTSS